MFVAVSRLGFASCRRACLATSLLSLLAPLAPLTAQDGAPPERPRVRPPSALSGVAQWEKGEALLQKIKIPPAPVLSADEALRSFKLAPGYRIELVAAEPMVQKPISFEFDPEGRIWVVEYQGYMRDLHGSAEGEPICRVVVLEDTDGDGRADKSTVFLDGLVMPRSISFVKGGVLIQEPPRVWFCEDLDGDLRSDRKREVGRMGVAGNPQHTANGLRFGIDNWLHCADSETRYRWRGDRLEEARTVKRGQFGVTFDEQGRFLTSYQNKALHGDYIPAEYLLRNPNFQSEQFGVNVDLAPEASLVYPSRVTPAITLGALELRDDGRLRTYTVVSGACYYDGHQFPADARRNVFIPESGGHLIGRLVLGDGITPKATRYYPEEQEFLTSTDERFRPVNARVGPDGALYLADMYHGIIEHVIFMVPWLEKQIRDRALDRGNDYGRIWRIVAEDRPLDRASPRLSTASSGDLVRVLGHPNGWHRLTAQRLLVERADAVAELRAHVAAASGLGKLHALWTLAGLEALDDLSLHSALQDTDERVRAAGVRLSEARPELLSRLRDLAADSSPLVRVQLMLTLGSFTDPVAWDLMRRLLQPPTSPLLRTAALTGLAGRELKALEEWRPQDQTLATMLALATFNTEDVGHIHRALRLMSRTPLDRTAVLGALTAVRWKRPPVLSDRPDELLALSRSPEPAVRDKALSAMQKLEWPGSTRRFLSEESLGTVTDEQRALIIAGERAYARLCAACHQGHGRGVPSVAPPLAGSEWVNGSVERLVRIVLHGVYGPIEVSGQTWNLAMPGLANGGSTDAEFAGILSYIRQAWGNSAAPVAPGTVAAVRAATADRAMPWRAEELLETREPAANGNIIQAAADGTFLLEARDATVFGRVLAYRVSLDVLAPWRVPEELAEWRIQVATTGNYRVLVTLAADDVSSGNQFSVRSGRHTLIGTVPDTGGYGSFRVVEVGTLTVDPGVSRIVLGPHGPLRRELADVRAIRLIPSSP